MSKQTGPLPLPVRRALKKALPERVYLRHFGRHEEGSLAIWRTLAGRTDGAILDIGAFHGEFSLEARNVNASAPIFAFEPNPASLAVLRREVEGRRVEVVPVALSDTPSLLPFALDIRRSHLLTSGEAHGDVVQVPTEPLDDWARQRGVRPRLLKIDVEGAESAVLRGARETLERDRPIVLMEILGNEAGERAGAEIPAGFQFFRIDENRGIQPRAHLTREHWAHKNWLVVPGERLGEIAGLRRA